MCSSDLLPILLGPPPLSFSVFQFRHNLLFLAVFRVLNFRSRFEALNDIFWVSFYQRNEIRPKSCGPRIELLMMYHVRQTEIVCQSYVPGKLKHQFTQTGPIVLALHLLGLGFWMFRVLHCFSIINRPSSLILT